MKKIFSILMTGLLVFTTLISCGGGDNLLSWSDIPASELFTKTETITIDGAAVVAANPNNAWAFWTQNLEEKFWNQTATFTFSCDMVINAPDDSGHLMWQVNTNGSYPLVASVDFGQNDTSVKHVEVTNEIQLGSRPVFYLSTYNEDAANGKFSNLEGFKITVDNFNLKIDYTVKVPANFSEDDYWLNTPSLKEALKDSGIEHFGLSVTAPELLNDQEKQQGLQYHATSTTMGNEFKPDSLFAWQLNPNTGKKAKFKASNGLEIDVPQTLPGLANTDAYLAKCKELGLKMRGHVLVWYSQTPAQFFDENYSFRTIEKEKKTINVPVTPVTKDTMTARQEWYIKTVLDYITAWETANMPAGEHIIYAWDVVNEALSDGAASNAYLRKGDNSNWAKIYGDENYEYIINAFRFANKYAPKDVQLAYNDYNEASGAKFQGYLKIIDEIQKHKNDENLPTRIDIAGMQSHNIPDSPSLRDYENAIKTFINKGLDVQITELDITGNAKPNTNWTEFDPPSDRSQKATYKAYFNLYLKYAKTEEKEHGINSVTIWGINDEDSWRASGTPLIFRRIGNKYYVKDAYYGVLEAVK